MLEIGCVYLAFLFMPNPNYEGIFRVFFKLVYACSFVYLLNIFIMAILDKETLRNYLIFIDPKLSAPLQERDYSLQCDLYTPQNPTSNFANIKSMIDVYISAHFFGWLVKSLIFRNNILAWTLSIGFEIMEISLKHILPNFNECWWDHLILDLFGCNLLGILVGNYLIKKFKIRKHHWFFQPTEYSEKLTYFQRFKYFFTSVP